ncbi:MAG: phosphate signaling complex protein PhoU [Elusimicrobiota bacterium]|jgi:phosphate transport system protein|nr:phosphate signaling complex protein PhoU [Elusimicrobiota bacterium]
MRHFDAEIIDLKSSLVETAELVKKMIQIIRKQFEDPSCFSAQLNDLEREVNIDEIVIDNKCLKLIALNQPVGRDLRFITSAMKINTDLERMADETISIGAKIMVKRFSEAEVEQAKPEIKMASDQIERILKMTDIVQEMVESAIKAFNTSDADLAKTILAKDDELAKIRESIVGYLQKAMAATSDEQQIKIYVNYIMILRSIQRIGSHATNIGEDVIFIAQGKDIRHIAGQKAQEPIQ